LSVIHIYVRCENAADEELRRACDAALADARAGLGPLFANSIQPTLLERPQAYVEDQIPLLSAAARARLALLDAEDALGDSAIAPAALKRKVDKDIERLEANLAEFQDRVGLKLDDFVRNSRSGRSLPSKSSRWRRMRCSMMWSSAMRSSSSG
jgi:hypothetical protein